MNFVFDIDGTLCFDGQHIDNRIISRLKAIAILRPPSDFCISTTYT